MIDQLQNYCGGPQTTQPHLFEQKWGIRFILAVKQAPSINRLPNGNFNSEDPWILDLC